MNVQDAAGLQLKHNHCTLIVTQFDCHKLNCLKWCKSFCFVITQLTPHPIHRLSLVLGIKFGGISLGFAAASQKLPVDEDGHRPVVFVSSGPTLTALTRSNTAD